MLQVHMHQFEFHLDGVTFVFHPPFLRLIPGFLFFKKSKLQIALIQSWLNLYDSLLIEHNQAWDQASFRSVIWDFINGNSFTILSCITSVSSIYVRLSLGHLGEVFQHM